MKIKKNKEEKNPMKERTICFYVALFSSDNAMVQLSRKYIPLFNFTSQPYAGTRRKKKAKKMKNSILKNLRSNLTREVPFLL